MTLFNIYEQQRCGCKCSSQALHGITRQNPAAMGAVMEGFMAEIERVHPLLSKDAVRKEVNDMGWILYRRSWTESCANSL